MMRLRMNDGTSKNKSVTVISTSLSSVMGATSPTAVATSEENLAQVTVLLKNHHAKGNDKNNDDMQTSLASLP